MRIHTSGICYLEREVKGGELWCSIVEVAEIALLQLLRYYCFSFRLLFIPDALEFLKWFDRV